MSPIITPQRFVEVTQAAINALTAHLAVLAQSDVKLGMLIVKALPFKVSLYFAFPPTRYEFTSQREQMKRDMVAYTQFRYYSEDEEFFYAQSKSGFDYRIEFHSPLLQAVDDNFYQALEVAKDLEVKKNAFRK